MTGKESLELILDGRVPDRPPHWELVFQIEREMLGMDPDIIAEADKAAFQLDVFLVWWMNWVGWPPEEGLVRLNCDLKSQGH